jgi:hypothetical protein
MFKSHIDSKLDQEIISALKELEKHESTSDEYGLVVDRIAKLEKLKSDSGLKPPSLDTVLIVGANIFSVLWLTRFERENVIPSKSALGFVMKPR